jgi:hypothetical protein
VRHAALIAAALVVAYAVSAAGDIRTDHFNIGSGATEGGSVACGKGDSVTGGGFSLKQTSTEHIRIHSSYPANRGWKAEGYTLDAPGRGSVSAVCAKDNSLFLKTKTKKVPEGVEEGQAFAHCPKGSKALGGGGNSPGNNAGLRGSFPGGDGRSWGARYDVYSPPARIKAFVVCDPHPRGITVVEDDVVAPAARRGTRSDVTAKAQCPEGSKVLGGGHYSSDDFTYYLSSGPTNQTWRVVASAYPNTTVIAYGACKKR